MQRWAICAFWLAVLSVMLFPSRTSNSNKFLIDKGSLYNGILSYDINVDRVRMYGARMACPANVKPRKGLASCMQLGCRTNYITLGRAHYLSGLLRLVYKPKNKMSS